FCLEIAKKRHQANPVVLSFAAYNLCQQFVRIINKVSIRSPTLLAGRLTPQPLLGFWPICASGMAAP
ncbi:hypothetical protein, partial [uncultured Lamprocystis sp.]|uniref:hypothetical protein n=1 Tax=uncultured Lamprocystis sp. TaxID=543132 RepID=UPI0025FC1A6F